MVMKENVLLVDCRNLIDRYWYATKDIGKTLKMVDSKITGTIDEFDIRYVMIATDIPGAQTIRHNFYPEYKKDRERDEEKEKAISFITDYIKQKYYCISNERYEADDFIASAVETLKSYTDRNIFILSTDKDLFSLVSSNVFCLDHSKNNQIINRDKVFEKLGVYPEQVNDFLSLMGDQADAIPGAKGIGKKTAAKLFSEYNSLKDIYENIDTVDKKYKGKLVNEKENIIKSYKLVKLQKKLLPSISLEMLDMSNTKSIAIPESMLDMMTSEERVWFFLEWKEFLVILNNN